MPEETQQNPKKILVNQLYEKNNQGEISNAHKIGASFENVIDTRQGRTPYTLAQIIDNYMEFMDKNAFVYYQDGIKDSPTNSHIKIWIDTNEGNASQLPPPLELKDIDVKYLDAEGDENVFPSPLTLINNDYLQIIVQATYQDPVTQQNIFKNIPYGNNIQIEFDDSTAFEIINNYVRPIKNGSYTMTVKYTDNVEKIFTADITVDLPVPQSIKILHNGSEITDYTFEELNESIKLDCQILMSDGSIASIVDYPIVWNSSDDSKVSVNNGEITSLANTTDPVTISVQLQNDTSVFNSIEVTVNYIQIEDLVLFYKTAENDTLIEADSYEFTDKDQEIILYPQIKYSDGTYEYKSDAILAADSTHVIIDGFKITSVDDGTTIISVSWNDEDGTSYSKDFTCKVSIPVVPEELLIYYNNGTEEVPFPDNYKFETRWDEGVVLIPKVKMSDGTIVSDNIKLTLDKGSAYFEFDSDTNILKPSTKYNNINKTDIQLTFSWSDANA